MARADMSLAQARYAAAVSARSAHVLRARHVPDALARLGLVRPGDALVVCADDFADALTERFPRESLFFAAEPTAEAFTAAAPTGDAPRTFWLVNSIGGFGLRVPDLRALAAAARDAGALFVVDNTVPSAFGCEPLKLGAHLSFEALDRVGGGCLSEKLVAVAAPFSRKGRKHPADPLADVAFALLGEAVAASGPTLLSVGENDAALLARGLDTLAERMQRHMDHARAIAEYLRCHPRVARVHYPGLLQHPDHAVAAGVLIHGCGPAVDFELAGGAAARFLAVCPCANREAPAGGPATRIAALKGDEARYLRLFAGVDDPLDIVDSLDQALRLFCNPPEP